VAEPAFCRSCYRSRVDLPADMKRRRPSGEQGGLHNLLGILLHQGPDGELRFVEEMGLRASGRGSESRGLARPAYAGCDAFRRAAMRPARASAEKR
jgi:hypothetical protein